MTKLNNHTKLMNLMIALSQKNPNFPYPLFQVGYALETILPYFSESGGALINPDLQFKSEGDNNLIFIECKSGNLEHQQALNFKKVKKDDIIEKGVTSLDVSSLNFEFIYFCSSNNKDVLIKADNLYNYNFPILCFNEDKIELIKNDIKGEKLKSLFPIFINNKYIPTEYYPYGPDDKKEYISLSIFQSLLHIMNDNEEFNVEMIIKDNHKLYDFIDSKGKTKLKEVVGKILSDLEQNELKDMLRRLRNQPKFRIINPKSYKKFRDICQNLIKEYKEDIDQLPLSEFGEVISSK